MCQFNFTGYPPNPKAPKYQQIQDLRQELSKKASLLWLLSMFVFLNQVGTHHRIPKTALQYPLFIMKS